MKTILVDIAHTFFIYNQGIFKEMYDLLEEYPNRKILVTNAGTEKMEKEGMVNLPYEVFSLENNPPKSEPEYFARLLKHYVITCSDVIYFDHSMEYINSAESIGITSYYYDSEKKDLVSLKKFLDDKLS